MRVKARLDPPPRYEAPAGAGLPEVAFTLVFFGAACPSGIEVEVSGDALALLDIEGVELRVLPEPPSVEIVTYAAEPAPGGTVFALRGVAPGSLCFLALKGRTRAPGRGALRVRVSGAGLDTTADVEARIVEPARLPLLPQKPLDPPFLMQDLLSRWSEAYQERTFARGWLAFDSPFPPLAELLVSWAEVLSRHLLASAGSSELHVALVQEGIETQLPPLTTGGSLIAVETLWLMEALAEGGLLRLRSPGSKAGEIVVLHQAGGDPRLSAELLEAQQQHPSRQIALTPIELCWLIPRPALNEPVAALARDMDAFVRQACMLDTCVGAAVLSSGPTMAELPGPFPYELLASTAPASNRVEWVKRHVRTPGWRTLIPREATRSTPVIGCPGAATAAGFLIAAADAEPFSVSSATTTEVEQCVLGYVGSRAEVERFLP